MLYNYKETINIYKTDYKIKQAILNGLLIKIENGIYSDGKNNYTDLELILKKYNKAFLVKESALFFYKIIDQPPERIHIGTARNALRIKDSRVKQHFYSRFSNSIDTVQETIESNSSIYYFSDSERYMFSLDARNVFSYITENGNEERVLLPQAVIFDLFRDSKKYSPVEFRMLLERFIDCPVLYEFSAWQLEDELYENKIPYDYSLEGILREIERESYRRNFQRTNFDY